MGGVRIAGDRHGARAARLTRRVGRPHPGRGHGRMKQTASGGDHDASTSSSRRLDSPVRIVGDLLQRQYAYAHHDARGCLHRDRRVQHSRRRDDLRCGLGERLHVGFDHDRLPLRIDLSQRLLSRHQSMRGSHGCRELRSGQRELLRMGRSQHGARALSGRIELHRHGGRLLLRIEWQCGWRLRMRLSDVLPAGDRLPSVRLRVPSAAERRHGRRNLHLHLRGLRAGRVLSSL